MIDWSDPQAVMAAGTVATVVFAALALLVSIVGLVRSTRASSEATSARQDANAAQWKMSEHLEAIAAATADAVKAAARGDAVSGAVLRGGRLSARLWKAGRSERLSIANTGAESVTIMDIELDDPSILVHGARESVHGAELDPGEQLDLVVGLSMATKLPMNVRLRWHDASGEQTRKQRLTLQ
jgi:hypothetical protein